MLLILCVRDDPPNLLDMHIFWVNLAASTNMQAPSPTTGLVGFGIFQLDPKSRELYRAGLRVKLQDQPCRVLSLLVGRAGQIVTREELRQNIWPTDVYIAFDQGLNNAIKKIRVALGDSAENPRFIETVAKQGYRFVAPVTGVQITGVQTTKTVQAIAAQPRSDSRIPRLAAFKRAALVILIAAPLLAALGYFGWRAYANRAAGLPPEKIVLAVLPFDNLSRDPDQEFFSDGLTEEMIAQLDKLNPERLTVIARGSVAKYKGTSFPINQIGKELHADYLVEGSVRRASDQVRITVQLIRVGDQTDLWAESYDRELKDILALQNSVAGTIANQIHITLTARQQARLASPHHPNPEAYDAYLKGRYYWNKRTADGMSTASRYFQEAIDKDSGYGAAYSGLADCNSGLAWHGFKSPSEALTKAYAAALKAVEIDPESAEAHASLALVLHHKWDWDRAGAEFQRALQLDPRYANAHHWYGDYLSVHGRHEEAMQQAKQALELDPLNLMIGTWVGLRSYLDRKYDAGIEESRNTVDLDPNFAASHLVLGENYVQKGLYQQAGDELQTAARLSGSSPLYVAQVAVADAAAGRKIEALRIVADLQNISHTRYVSPYGLAQVYAALNDKEQTLKWLQKAYDDHSVWMSYLAVDPLFDRFRSDEHFQDLERRVGFIQ